MRYWKNDLYPPERLILRAQIEHQSCKPIGRDDLACAICGAVLARSAADVKHESALGKGFRSPCRGRSLGRPAPSEPMKLLPGARTRLWALVSF